MIRFTTLALSAALAFAIGTPASSQSIGVQEGTAGGGYAVVTLSGKLVHAKNVANYNHTGAGTYVVKFNNDVSSCSAAATIARRGKNSLVPGYIVVANGGRQDDRLTVSTFDSVTLLPRDFPFDLTVIC